MDSEATISEFRVQYRLLDSDRVCNSTFASASIYEVLETLRSEGVTPANVDHLYVHQLLPDGNTAEVVAVEPKYGKVKPGHGVEDGHVSNVVPISKGLNKKERRLQRKKEEKERKQAAASKPHLRMKNMGASKADPVHSLFYTAYPA